jgi:hypothetical protein
MQINRDLTETEKKVVINLGTMYMALGVDKVNVAAILDVVRPFLQDDSVQDRKHFHGWHFVEIQEGATLYETNIDDYSSFAMYMADRKAIGKKPDTAIFVCECGRRLEKEIIDESK